MSAFLTSAESWQSFPDEISANEQETAFLQQQADFFLRKQGPAVTDKIKAGPGGDPHDYVSQAPYWWPDPQQPDGLPYLKRDGELNPEMELSDRARLEEFREGVSCLILRSQLPGGSSYAAQAARYVRRWFLDPETRMNPHLRYGQFIPGLCEGRGIGIIDTHSFCFLLDEISHLPAEHWTAQDQAGLRIWFDHYLEWLLESDHGQTESREHNNHGTWYDAQVVCFALFCGRREIALRQIEEFSRARLAQQLSFEGRQPHEMERTLSLSYCTFNLIAFSFLAQASRHLDLNLWQEEPAILRGIRWMLPYYLETQPWTWPQVKPFNRLAPGFLLSLAAQGSGEVDLRLAADSTLLNRWNRISGWGIDVRIKSPDENKGTLVP